MTILKKLDENMCIRLFRKDVDDIDSLTHLLNMAYKTLADRGLNYVAARQGPDITLQRLQKAKCFIILYKDKIIGTLSYYSFGIKKGCDWYKNHKVGVVGQFAVYPSFQKRGLGTVLLELAEEEAKREGMDEISLDTAEQATHLQNFYEKHGYRFVGKTDWKDTNYISVVMSKKIKK